MSRLLCDFHIHTTWSDGKLPLSEVVDLYGETGHDVICITDHIVDEKYKASIKGDYVNELNFEAYKRLLWEEQKRAWKKYKMLVIPGVEITNLRHGYHAVIIDIKTFIDAEKQPFPLIREAHHQNALVIACHPYPKEYDGEAYDGSAHLRENLDTYRHDFDAWEIANGRDLFTQISSRNLPHIGNSDFHKKDDFYSWRTIIICEKNIEAVKEAIRNQEGISISLLREKEKNPFEWYKPPEPVLQMPK